MSEREIILRDGEVYMDKADLDAQLAAAYAAGVAAAVAVCRERAKQWEEMPDFGSLAASVKFHLQAESKSCADAIEQLADHGQAQAAGDGETR